MKKFLVGLTISLGAVAMAHAAGDPNAGQAKAQVCAACHGGNGVGIAPTFPNLAGQNASYLAKQIREIRDGARNVPQMAGMVDNFSDQDALDVAAYFSGLPANLGQADPALAEKGRNLYRAGDLAKGIPACTACHSPTGQGNAPAAYPALSGQHSAYTVTQLKNFRSGERNNDPNSMMRIIANKMSDSEMEAVADFVSGLHGKSE